MTDNNKTDTSTRRDFLKTAGLATAAVAGGVLTAGVAQASSGHSATKKEYAGKTAFITGGARGIGLATAQMFASHGANIVIFDIASTDIKGVGYEVANKDDLAKAKATIEKQGVSCLTVTGDVRNKKSLDKAVNQAISLFGTIDFMVANAGVTQIGYLPDFNETEVEAVIDINVSGVIKTTQAVIPQMIKQQSGRIVFISSILGRKGNRDWPIYAASKWAVIGFAKSAAHLLGKHNITCNTLCPGLVDTKLVNNDFVLKRWLPHDPKWENVVGWVEQNHPIPKGVYQPAEIANAVKIFCDPVTDTVTGEVFDISMGSSAEGLG